MSFVQEIPLHLRRTETTYAVVLGSEGATVQKTKRTMCCSEDLQCSFIICTVDGVDRPFRRLDV